MPGKLNSSPLRTLKCGGLQLSSLGDSRWPDPAVYNIYWIGVLNVSILNSTSLISNGTKMKLNTSTG